MTLIFYFNLHQKTNQCIFIVYFGCFTNKKKNRDERIINFFSTYNFSPIYFVIISYLLSFPSIFNSTTAHFLLNFLQPVQSWSTSLPFSLRSTRYHGESHWLFCFPQMSNQFYSFLIYFTNNILTTMESIMKLHWIIFTPSIIFIFIFLITVLRCSSSLCDNTIVSVAYNNVGFIIVL